MLGFGHILFPSLSPKHPLYTMPRKRTCSDPVQPAHSVQPPIREGAEAPGALVHPPVSGSKGCFLGARALQLPAAGWGGFVLSSPPT